MPSRHGAPALGRRRACSRPTPRHQQCALPLPLVCDVSRPRSSSSRMTSACRRRSLRARSLMYFTCSSVRITYVVVKEDGVGSGEIDWRGYASPSRRRSWVMRAAVTRLHLPLVPSGHVQVSTWCLANLSIPARAVNTWSAGDLIPLARSHASPM